jgi:hypothetical protein
MVRNLEELADTLQIPKGFVEFSIETDWPKWVPGFLTKVLKMRHLFPAIYVGSLGVFTWLSVRGSLP